MDEIEKRLLEVNVTAPRIDFKDGSRNITMARFRIIPERFDLAYKDEILGIAYYGGGDINHAYMAYRRAGNLLKASFKQRPIRHDYNDKEYWETNQTWFGDSDIHQYQHTLWNNIMRRNDLKILIVGV